MGKKDGYGPRRGGQNRQNDDTVERVVQFAKTMHSLSEGSEGLLGEQARRDRQRAGQIAFELARVGLSAWRDLMELQRGLEPDLLVSLLRPSAPAAPDEGLVSDRAVVHTQVEKKPGGGREATFELTLENLTDQHQDLVVPRFLEFERSDRLDVLTLALRSTPAAPLLGPGDHAEIKFRVVLDQEDQLRPGSRAERPSRYTARMLLRSRSGLELEVPVVLRAMFRL